MRNVRDVTVGKGEIYGNAHTSTGVACAIFPTSSSACMIFFIRAATGFFLGGMVADYPMGSCALRR